MTTDDDRAANSGATTDALLQHLDRDQRRSEAADRARRDDLNLVAEELNSLRSLGAAINEQLEQAAILQVLRERRA